jgi:hypothetical protein
MKRFALSFLLLLSFSSSAIAWSGAGHMVIAGIAYKELSIGTKEKVNALLKAHPDYQKWAKSFTAEGAIDLETFVFLRASTWPDEIRRKHNDYDHPQWHYIDYPLRPPNFDFEDVREQTNDVVFGLKEAEKVVADKKAPAEARAANLSWLEHLVGDIHQPLHCASYFSKEFPKGDKGGNSFYVKPATKGIKLHSLWDGLLGTRNQVKSALNDGTRIRVIHPPSEFPDLGNGGAKEWSLDGRKLAIDKAYLNGKLKSSAKNDPPGTLPKEYTREAKKVAEKQAALAGYRLAAEIEKLISDQ